MADHHEPLFDHATESFKEGKSSSSSDSDDYKSSPVKVPLNLKSKVNRLFGRDKPVHKVLGGGQSANIFLWRNRKKSATVLGGATAVWFLFELLQYHLVTLVCHLLIVFLAALFFLSNASVFLGRGPPKIPQVVISDKCVIEIVSALNIEINRAFLEMRNIASGKDLKKFLSVIAGLWFISGMGKWFNFLTLLYICVLMLFTLPVGYEKYEDQVDSFAEKAMVEIKKQYKVLDAQVLSKMSRGAVKKD